MQGQPLSDLRGCERLGESDARAVAHAHIRAVAPAVRGAHVDADGTAFDRANGAALAKELLPLQATEPTVGLQLKGYVSSANYASKKLVFLLL